MEGGGCEICLKVYPIFSITKITHGSTVSFQVLTSFQLKYIYFYIYNLTKQVDNIISL